MYNEARRRHLCQQLKSLRAQGYRRVRANFTHTGYSENLTHMRADKKPVRAVWRNASNYAYALLVNGQIVDGTYHRHSDGILELG